MIFHLLQTAQYVYKMLKDGVFGDCENEIENFLVRYRVIFPHATDFKLPTEPSLEEENHEVIDELGKEAN